MASISRTPPVPGTFVVEGYWPATGAQAFRAANARLDVSLAAMRGEGIAIEAVAATLVPSDETALWMVAAPSAEVVALACANAQLHVERIVAAVELRAGQAVGSGRLEPDPVAGDSLADVDGGRTDERSQA